MSLSFSFQNMLRHMGKHELYLATLFGKYSFEEEAMGDDNGRGLPAQKRQEEGKIEKNMFHSGVEFLVGL